MSIADAVAFAAFKTLCDDDKQTVLQLLHALHEGEAFFMLQFQGRVMSVHGGGFRVHIGDREIAVSFDKADAGAYAAAWAAQ